METRITKLFGIKYPIILPGMSWISVPELVAAVCNAGGIGWLATGPLNTEQTRASIRRIRELTDKPFGAGATLLMPGARENAEVILEEKVPVVNVSLGKCDWIAERAHKYGGKVIATVTTEKHAIAAEKQGADALQVTGNEAAAHGSQVTTLVLTPAIVKAVKIPVVAIGGFADGHGLAAALALGAEGIGMGTRLSMTKESPVHELTKKAQIEASIDDTIYSNRFDGLYCRVLKSPQAEKSIRQGISLPRAMIVGPRIARELKLPLFKLMLGMLAQPANMMKLAHMSTAFDKIRCATENGDLKYGVHLTGQVQGIINDMPTVKEVIDRTVKEALEVYARMGTMLK
ncbi:MAG TPA: nitronate monooxygenase [Spirochaetota bacterium]|nr:nitronate monooxygenase [Spirochaetota bacterium]HOD15012.1 nitronate monooxygenase [Spirochaetota bacterium]HPG50744.1 nitronate monooxygenase [Spirochaetota bacterium]HPN10538.1 nitronate monooxygenase [Spirochaetota bacterium]